MSGRWFAVAVAALFVGYTSLAGRLPVLDDELYYWCWSKDLQLSYYDHPPMTALMIRASTAVFGDTVLGVRFPACVAAAVVLGVIGWLTRPRAVLFGTVLTPLFTFGAVMVTPDTPLLLFWSLYLAWLVVVHRRLTPGDSSHSAGRVSPYLWVLGGVLLGCMILGKYTAGLAVPAGFASFLLLGVGSCRRWLIGYAAHLGVAFLVSSPILIHNWRADFAPLLYQWRHATAADEPGLKAAGEFLGVQVLLVGTLPLVLLPWVVWRLRTLTADPRLRVCVCLYALPLAFFTWKSSRGPLEGNWALVSYLAFWPVAAEWFVGLRAMNWKWRWFWVWGGRLAFVAPAGCVAVLGTHLVHPLPVLPVHNDRVTRQYHRFDMAAAVAEYLDDHPGHPPVFTDTYQNVALLRFHGVDARQEMGIHRPSHFTQTAERMLDHPAVLYLSNGPLEEKEDDSKRKGSFAGHTAGFERRLVAEFPIVFRGETYDTYKLWCYQKPTPRPTDPPPARGVFSFRP